jgi:hypothetical protein
VRDRYALGNEQASVYDGVDDVDDRNHVNDNSLPAYRCDSKIEGADRESEKQDS